MKFSSFTLVALAALEGADAYLTPHHTLVSSRAPPVRTVAVNFAASATAESSSSTDVSIPYDAAAELAYAEWINKYNRPYDAERYEVFKKNYKAITVMNVTAKKKARETGSDEASLLTLNEYADFTAEEYEAVMQGSGSVGESTTGDILGEAVAAAESQSVASSALQDAANALAEEEEKLAAQLGLDSVEELELAIDEMEGISEEGTMMESDNLAREARVRSAYMEWCKEYSKQQDESRFPQFYKNFLEMEEFAKESGKDMVLNEYADFTEEEYANLLSAKEEAEAAALQAKAEEEAAAKAKAEAEAAAKAKAAAEKEAAARAQAEALKKAEEEERKRARAEAARLAAMTEEERRKEIEKEKNARQSAQAKEMEKAVLESEAAAIAAATAAAAAEAKAAAKRRQIEEEAYELARAKAREWEEKQARLAAERQPFVEKKQAPKASKTPASAFGVISNLASKVAPPAKKEIEPKKEAPAIMKIFEAPAKKDVPKKASPVDSLASFFSSPTPTKKEAPKTFVAPKPAIKAATKPKKSPAPRPSLNLASIFESQPSTSAPKPKPDAKVASPKSVSASSPTLNLGSLFESKPPAKKSAPPAPTPELKLKPAPKLDTSDPVTEAFSSLFGGSKKKPEPKPAPAPPSLASKKSTGGFFGSFSSPAPKKVAPAPTPAPAPKAAPSTSFSFFSKPETKKASPVQAPPPKKRQSFSLFNTPKPAAAKPQPEAKAAPSRPTLSLFASKPKEATKAPPTPAKPAAPFRPTLAIFGNSSPSKTMSKKAALEDNIPVLSQWTQNPDGSITGLVSNSKSFRNGTRITTSPVRKGAKKGTTVKTGSGSQYILN